MLVVPILWDFVLFYGMLKLLCLLINSETYGLKIPNPTDSKLEANCAHISFLLKVSCAEILVKRDL